MGEPVTSVQWMHSCYDCPPKADVAILTVKEKVVTIDPDTNKILSAEPRLRQYINPTRKVWITKPEHRKHKYKKEYEDLNKCDVFKVEDRLLLDFLKDKFEIDKWKWIGKKEICNSPYIYGTDISMEALVRYRYENNQRHAITPITCGALDIESSMIHPDRRTNCITAICDKKIYTAALKEFAFTNVGKQRKALTVDDLLGCVAYEFRKAVKDDKTSISMSGTTLTFKRTKKDGSILKYDLEIIATIVETEKELYDFIFTNIHADEPDYMFIWNLGYDVPQIIARMEDLGLDPKDYFCSPQLSKNRRYLKYYEDRKKVQHIIQKWNWLHCSAMTQWLDAMALFGQVRKTRPKESSYNLSEIMSNMLKMEKLDLGGLSHQEMQTNEFLKYWAYNIWDALLVQLGQWESLDYNSLYMLTERSTLMDFSKQTVMLCNDYHHVLLEDGKVLSSTGKVMAGPYDYMLSKVGGAVLDAKNVVDIGVNCVAERPDQMTNVLVFTADDDYSALYPSWKIACGIAKDNKLATLVDIENQPNSAIELLSSALSSPDENSVWICTTFFGLRDYASMDRYIAEQIKRNTVPF